MAGKKLSWIFELIDKMTGPGRRINDTLKKTDETLERVTGKAKKHTDALGRAAGATRKLGDAHRHAGIEGDHFFRKLTAWYLGVQAFQGTVVGIAESLLRLPYAFAKAGVAAASFKENTMLGLNMMLRDPKKSKALYEEAVNFADISPFETQETLQWYRQLLGAMGPSGLTGIGTPGGTRILKILAGLGDIASTQPSPSLAMGRILMQVTQMLNKPHALMSDLRVMAESGLPLNAMYGKLAQRHGITLAEAQSSKWEGKFGSAEALQAILEVSAERFGGGVLGGGMGPASHTLTGLWSTLVSRPYRMMEDLGNTAGFKSMKAALENLVAVLDPASPSGKRIKANVELLFDKILGGVFNRFQDPKSVEAWVNSVLDGLTKIIPRMEALAKAVGSIAENLGKIGTASKIWSEEGPFTGLWNAIVAERRAKGGAVSGGEIPETIANLRRLYGQKSLTPWDRVMLQQYEARARELGIPMQNFGFPAPTSTPAEKKPTGFNNEGGIHIHIDGAQDPRAVADELEDRLASLTERWAIGAGA